MLILLPPSEGKSPPTSGPPLDLGALSLPRLAEAREEVLAALVRLCSADPGAAARALGLSSSLISEVHRNAELRSAPTAPAAEVYSGVLYAALGLGGLAPRARRRVEEWVLVSSALWGALRLTDPIPAYRLAGGASLPGPGRLATHWRAPLAAAMAERAEDQVVLDLRSGTYAAMWTPPAELCVVGRVVHEVGGRRTVASHFNKATKGRLVRALAERRAEPASVPGLVRAIRSAGFRAELAEPEPAGRGRTARPAVLDLIVNAL